MTNEYFVRWNGKGDQIRREHVDTLNLINEAFTRINYLYDFFFLFFLSYLFLLLFSHNKLH